MTRPYEGKLELQLSVLT